MLPQIHCAPAYKLQAGIRDANGGGEILLTRVPQTTLRSTGKPKEQEHTGEPRRGLLLSNSVGVQYVSSGAHVPKPPSSSLFFLPYKGEVKKERIYGDL
jgi:hypothetical protein